MAPLRGPSSHERLWLASGCPFASNGVRRCPGLTKGLACFRLPLRVSWRATLPVAHERLFLAALVACTAYGGA